MLFVGLIINALFPKCMHSSEITVSAPDWKIALVFDINSFHQSSMR